MKNRLIGFAIITISFFGGLGMTFFSQWLNATFGEYEVRSLVMGVFSFIYGCAGVGFGIYYMVKDLMVD